MKIKTCAYLSLAIYSFVLYVACSKTVHPDDKDNSTITPRPTDSTINTPPTDSTYDTNNLVVNSTTCVNAPNYGDSIVYLKPKNGGDFFIDPVNNSGVNGTYFS